MYIGLPKVESILPKFNKTRIRHDPTIEVVTHVNRDAEVIRLHPIYYFLSLLQVLLLNGLIARAELNQKHMNCWKM